ncbi:MAG: MATE family efflux transporter [Lachnospira sp.]
MNEMNNAASAQLSEKDRKFREFALNDNLWKVIFHVCVPLSAFQLFQHMFNILDTMMASHVSAVAVSAVAYLSQIQSMIAAVGTGLAVGSSLKISEAYGAGDYELVKKRLSSLIAICAFLGAAVVLLIPFTPQFLRLMGTPDDFINVGTKYFIITIFSTVLSFFNNVYIAIERSRGNSKRILRLNMVVIILKLSITAFFIYGLNADITMIAVASVISQSFLFVMAIYNLLRGNDAFTFNVKFVRFNKVVVLPMLNLSFPVIVEKMAFAMGKTVVNSMSKNYGSTTVGALGISNNINGVCTQIQNGFQDGGASIISQNLGAGKTDRALGTFWRLLVINGLIGLVMYISLNVFIEPITYLFANSQEGFNAEFQQTIIHVFRYDSLGGCIPLGINAAVMSLLFGFGKTKLTLLCNFSRVFVFRIPILWALQNFTALGSESVGIVMGLSNFLTAMLSCIVAFFVIRDIKKKRE